MRIRTWKSPPMVAVNIVREAKAFALYGQRRRELSSNRRDRNN